jgi:ABC-2 type transport system permease protein
MTTAVIAKRELGAFFKSPVAYVVLALFLVVSGVMFFFGGFFVTGSASMEGYFGTMPILLLFICPAIAMRLIAEERGSGTIEMLLTFPVRDVEVVLGKYLAALGVLAVGLLASSMTKNQVVAFIVGWAICMALFILGWFASSAGPTLGPILQYASPAWQFQKITRGVIELRNIVYYLSAIGVCLVLTVQILESRKWR